MSQMTSRQFQHHILSQVKEDLQIICLGVWEGVFHSNTLGPLCLTLCFRHPWSTILGHAFLTQAGISPSCVMTCNSDSISFTSSWFTSGNDQVPFTVTATFTSTWLHDFPSHPMGHFRFHRQWQLLISHSYRNEKYSSYTKATMSGRLFVTTSK